MFFRDFPDGSVAKTLCSPCKGLKFNQSLVTGNWVTHTIAKD